MGLNLEKKHWNFRDNSTYKEHKSKKKIRKFQRISSFIKKSQNPNNLILHQHRWSKIIILILFIFNFCVQSKGRQLFMRRILYWTWHEIWLGCC